MPLRGGHTSAEPRVPKRRRYTSHVNPNQWDLAQRSDGTIACPFACNPQLSGISKATFYRIHARGKCIARGDTSETDSPPSLRHRRRAPPPSSRAHRGGDPEAEQDWEDFGGGNSGDSGYEPPGSNGDFGGGEDFGGFWSSDEEPPEEEEEEDPQLNEGEDLQGEGAEGGGGADPWPEVEVCAFVQWGASLRAPLLMLTPLGTPLHHDCRARGRTVGAMMRCDTEGGGGWRSTCSTYTSQSAPALTPLCTSG
jgi:hypothetical protein